MFGLISQRILFDNYFVLFKLKHELKTQEWKKKTNAEGEITFKCKSHRERNENEAKDSAVSFIQLNEIHI